MSDLKTAREALVKSLEALAATGCEKPITCGQCAMCADHCKCAEQAAPPECQCEACRRLRTEGVPTPCEKLAAEYRAQAAPPVEPCPARKALEKTPCRCQKTVKANNCPQCGELLWPVVYRGGALNEEQFMAVRAGDYYCKSCKGAEGNTGFKYFWERDFEVRIERCERCVALASPCSPCPRCDRLQATVKALVEGLRPLQTAAFLTLDDNRRIAALVAEHDKEKA